MELWLPFATTIDPLTTEGDYEMGHPRGAVVHYTAGKPGKGALATARADCYTYLLIDTDGTIYQGFPLNRWGSHAGLSSWPSLGEGVSKHLVGIEIACAGKLAADPKGNWHAWWGDVIPADSVRVVPKADNRVAGCYERYTAEQETTLVRTLLWLKNNAPTIFDFDLVLGHDEVSPGRKEDPGGSLSMTMPELRAYLKGIYAP